tara:strand:+ start:516 stop:2633 length:2118 start_codon:yes stop_codon:yes gene_type:complete
MELNEEQQFIVDQIKDNKNVIVDAVAGTGKTTTILSLAEQLPKKSMLQITYNKSLKHEVREKIKAREIKNLSIHTYHSLHYAYYSNTGYTDIEMYKSLKDNLQPVMKIQHIDVLIVDEAQDMTLLYFRFLVKFLQDFKKKVTLLVLGDVMQGLYQFKGSDSRFLSLANEIWDSKYLKKKEFVRTTMRMSYRITNEIASFVNNVMIGNERMLACRSDRKVVYIRNSSTMLLKIVCGCINKLFEEGVKPQEIFILGPSVKGSKSIIRRLENILVQKDIRCHVPMMELDGGDERVSNGKIVFSTFHCVKGRERDYVFVVNFDNSYFTYYGRDMPKDVCPNTMYVANTRARKGLYVLEGDTSRYDSPLPFLRKTHLEMKKEDYIDFRGTPQSLFSVKPEMDYKLEHVTPTEIIKFIPVEVIEELSNLVDKMFICEQEQSDELDIPSVIETKNGYFEEISDMNGIAIPSMFYDNLKKVFHDYDEFKLEDCILYEMIDETKYTGKQLDMFVIDYINKLPETIDNMSDYLKLASINVAVQESLYFRLKQIEEDEYNWLSDSVVNQCMKRLQDTISYDCQNDEPYPEHSIYEYNNEDLHEKIDRETSLYIPKKKFRFAARVDLITENTVWEIKTTSELTIDHKLQLIIYAWLWEMRPQHEEKIFRLYNIKNNHLLRLNASLDELNEVIKKILKCRYISGEAKSDADFVKGCKR